MKITNEMNALARRVAAQKQAEMSTEASIALMKWLSKVAKKYRFGKHVYVVGGAVRNFLIDKPIKDIDMVVDSITLGRDAAWVAELIAREIPAGTRIETDNLMVSKIFIQSSWLLDGHQMEGEQIEIVNAREEVYETDSEGNPKGHKPLSVNPTSLEEDAKRRDFTFNTLMWRLLDLSEGPDKAEIVDITGCGQSDLAEGSMRCPMDADATFAQDPTRIIRTIKFAYKYGFKLPPDVLAAAKRQAKGLRRIPAKAWGSLRDIVLESPYYKKALLTMDQLGVIEVLSDMALEDKQFAKTLSNYAKKKGVTYLLDLMDVGLPAGEAVKFLDARQVKRLREVTTGMERDEAMEYLEALKNPGRATKDKKFAPSLALEYGYSGKQMAKFMPMVILIGRDALLENPDLRNNPNALKQAIREEVGRSSSAMRVAQRYEG